jgi:hypothetical protein
MNQIINQRVFRIAVFFWLLGWYLKSYFYVPYVFAVIDGSWGPTYIENTFFPSFLRNPQVLQFFYILPLSVFITFFNVPLFWFRLCSCFLVVSSGVFLYHQETYNDATFVTSLWTSLWLLWLSCNLNNTQEARRHGPKLAMGIVSVMFMAGFTGKLTPGYFEGEVVYNIFFMQKPQGVFLWLREILDPTQLHVLSVWISWGIILAEAFLATAFLFPFSWMSIIAPGVMVGVTVFCTWKILSVLSSLIGLLLASRLWSYKYKRGF